MFDNEVGESLQIILIVENTPWAGAYIAFRTSVRSDPDCKTLLVTANNRTLNPAFFKNAGYTIDDLVPVAQLMQGPSVIVVPSNSKYQTLQSLLDDARKHPSTISYGSAGVGTRSDERRVGQECVSTCRSRWSPDH